MTWRLNQGSLAGHWVEESQECPRFPTSLQMKGKNKDHPLWSSLIPLTYHQGQCWPHWSFLPLLDLDFIQTALPKLLEEADLVSLLADWDLTLPLEATASWWATSLCVSSLSKDRHSLLMAFQLWGWPPSCTGYISLPMMKRSKFGVLSKFLVCTWLTQTEDFQSTWERVLR